MHTVIYLGVLLSNAGLIIWQEVRLSRLVPKYLGRPFCRIHDYFRLPCDCHKVGK